MKRLLTLATSLVAFGGILFAQQTKTLPNPQNVPAKQENFRISYDSFSWTKLKTLDYTLTDLDGKEHNIAKYIAEGKKVLIDFSTTWCGWCWVMHQNGFLEKLNENFGPNGTQRQDLIILWVEAEGAAEYKIRDAGKNWTVKFGTDEDVPYPIISDGKAISALGFPIKGFPTVLFISAKGEAFNICESPQLIIGQYQSPNIKNFNDLLEDCPKANSKPEISEISSLDNAFTGESLKWNSTYSSTTPIIKTEWSFEGGTPATSSENNPVVAWNKAGTYKVKLTLTNKNGSTSKEISYKVGDPNTTKFPIVALFEGMTCDGGFRAADMDGDGYSWIPVRKLFTQIGAQALMNNPNALFGANMSKYAVVSCSNVPTGYNNGQFSVTRVHPDNWLISAPINIPADASNPTLFFSVNSFFNSLAIEPYKVLISTKGINRIDFTEVIKTGKSPLDNNKWIDEKVSLSKYKGKRIYIAFVHQTDIKGRGILLDNIQVSLDGIKGRKAIESTTARLYPSPAKDIVYVDGSENSEVAIFSLSGEMVLRTSIKSEKESIQLHSIPNGTYVVRITEPSGASKSLRLIVQH